MLKMLPDRRQKLLLLVTAIAIVVFIAGSWWGLQTVQASQRIRAQTTLETVLMTTHQAFVTWAHQEREAVAGWASVRDVGRITRDLAELPRDRDVLIESPEQLEIRQYFSGILAARTYDGFAIVATDGFVLAAAEDVIVGINMGDSGVSEEFARLLAGGASMTPPMFSPVPVRDADGNFADGRPAMFVGTPLFDSDGAMIGALIFGMNPSREFTALFQRGRLGDSGEAYAFNADGRLITESRFDQQLRDVGLIDADQRGVLNLELRDPGVDLLSGAQSNLPREQQPFTLMAQSAMSGETSFNIDGYRDYRGRLVIGAWLWDAEYALGVPQKLI